MVDVTLHTRLKLKKDKLACAEEADKVGELKLIKTENKKLRIERIVLINMVSDEVYYGRYRGIGEERGYDEKLILKLNTQLSKYAKENQMILLEDEDVRKWIDGDIKSGA